MVLKIEKKKKKRSDEWLVNTDSGFIYIYMICGSANVGIVPMFIICDNTLKTKIYKCLMQRSIYNICLVNGSVYT